MVGEYIYFLDIYVRKYEKIEHTKLQNIQITRDKNQKKKKQIDHSNNSRLWSLRVYLQRARNNDGLLCHIQCAISNSCSAHYSVE